MCACAQPSPCPPFPLACKARTDSPPPRPLPPSAGGQGISTFAKALGSAELQSLDITSCKLVGGGGSSGRRSRATEPGHHE